MVIRTDQVFERNQPAPRRGPSGCLVVFLLVLAVFIGGGVYLYIKIPQWLDNMDRGVVPWLERKGREIVGRVSLDPFLKVLQQSELSPKEKTDWDAFITDKWELAVTTENKALKRETVIEGSRDVVASYPGIYYALLYIQESGFRDCAMNPDQVRLGKESISKVTLDMTSGRYSHEQVKPVVEHLYSIITGWRVDHQKDDGTWETDAHRRNLCRKLLALDQSGERQGEGKAVDMPEAFRKELESLKTGILAAEAPQDGR